MHWIKKSILGMFVMFFLFIGLHILSAGGTVLFSAEFMGIGGLMLLLSMGFVETNFVTYE